MKRTLLITLGMLAVLVLLASFYQQLDRIKHQQQDVAELRQLVQQAVDTVASRDPANERDRILTQFKTRLGELESRIADASARGVETARLRDELDATRRDADRCKSELGRDINRTRELVDAYHREIRSIDRIAQESLHQTRSDLDLLTNRFTPDPRVLDQCLLSPTVQLNGDDTVGSGTIVYSSRNDSAGKVETYVITLYHVIRNILADTPTARRDGIAVTIYAPTGNAEERADMVCNNEQIDAALLKLRSERQDDRVARVASRRRAQSVRVWERIYAVGCPLGNDPIPTQGEIASVNNKLGGINYWMINAPTYFGNSGGGVFLADSRELVGVFSKIYTHGKGNPVVVPHMGLCTPLDAVHDWLAKEKLDFVLQPADAIAPDAATELASPPR